MLGSDLQAFRSQVQGELESLLACTLRLDAAGVAPVPAVTDGMRTTTHIQNGVMVKSQIIAFRIRRDLLKVIPTSGHRVTWEEQKETFRLETVGNAGTADPALVLNCIGKSEPA